MCTTPSTGLIGRVVYKDICCDVATTVLWAPRNGILERRRRWWSRWNPRWIHDGESWRVMTTNSILRRCDTMWHTDDTGYFVHSARMRTRSTLTWSSEALSRVYQLTFVCQLNTIYPIRVFIGVMWLCHVMCDVKPILVKYGQASVSGSGFAVSRFVHILTIDHIVHIFKKILQIPIFSLRFWRFFDWILSGGFCCQSPTWRLRSSTLSHSGFPLEHRPMRCTTLSNLRASPTSYQITMTSPLGVALTQYLVHQGHSQPLVHLRHLQGMLSTQTET